MKYDDVKRLYQICRLATLNARAGSYKDTPTDRIDIHADYERQILSAICRLYKGATAGKEVVGPS